MHRKADRQMDGQMDGQTDTHTGKTPRYIKEILKLKENLTH